MKAGDSFSFTGDIQVYHRGPVSMYMGFLVALSEGES